MELTGLCYLMSAGQLMYINIMEYALVLLCFYDFLLVVRFRPSSKINPSTLAVLRMIIHGSYSVSKRVLVSIRLGHMWVARPTHSALSCKERWLALPTWFHLLGNLVPRALFKMRGRVNALPSVTTSKISGDSSILVSLCCSNFEVWIFLGYTLPSL